MLNEIDELLGWFGDTEQQMTWADPVSCESDKIQGQLDEQRVSSQN